MIGVERTKWTDERIDDAFARMDRQIDLLREEMREEFRDVREEMRAGFEEMRSGFGETRGNILSLQRQIAKIGWAVAGTMAASMTALLVALL